MKDRTFLLTLFGAALTMLGVIAVTPLIPGTTTAPDAVWADGLYRQKIHALNQLPAGRIYTVSGSSSLFSLDTQVLSQAVGKPVVNLGTHAGLGLNYIVDRAERQMRPGDTIIFTPEYPILQQPADPNQITLAFVAFFDRSYIASRPLAERTHFYLGYGFPDAIWETLKILHGGASTGLVEAGITIDSLGNARGNSVAKSFEDTRGFAPVGVPLPISTDAIATLREFAARAKKRHVQIISFPTSLVHLPGWDTPRQQELRRQTRSTLQALGLNPRGNDQTGWIEPAGIYDAAFHANDVGRAAYTRRITVLLCAQMICAHPPH